MNKAIIAVAALAVIIGGFFLLRPKPHEEAPEAVGGNQATAVEAVSTTTPATTTPSTVSEPAPTPKPVVTPTPKPTPKPAALTVVKKLLPAENSEPREKPITHVVVHFISNVSENQQDPYNIDGIIGIFKASGLSSHYLIERDGTIYQLTEENRVAYHAGKGELAKFPDYTNKLNHYSIGIEIAAMGTQQEMAEFITGNKYQDLPKSDLGYTAAQYAALNKLLNDIYARNPGVKKDRDHIIGHDEYAPGRKHDPGSLFDWTRIGF